jgi:hypothetical protein
MDDCCRWLYTNGCAATIKIMNNGSVKFTMNNWKFGQRLAYEGKQDFWRQVF